MPRSSKSRFTAAATLAGAAFALAACTNTPLYGGGAAGGGSYPVGGYPAPAYGGGAYAQWGEVVNVEVIRGGTSSGTIGTIAGGVLGGLAGNQIGGGTGRTVATVAGAVGGALVGRAVEQNTRPPSADYYRVSVRLENGAVRTFDYHEPPNVRIGERVRLEGDQLYR